jgi:hypothetical protein
MWYRMFDSRGKHIMNLRYKPGPLDLICNDETRDFYKVVEINDEKRFCIARWQYQGDYRGD